MNYPFNALGLSHKYMAENVRSGAFLIDATAGRGRDTLLLSKLTGENGKVLAFDIQEHAIESTKELLHQNNATNVTLICDCHSKMDQYADENSVDGIMFNFGWLPGGDHTRFSTAVTSLSAIEKGLKLLKVGGIMTLCLYCGKENGYEEKNEILKAISMLDQKKYSVLVCDFVNRKGDPPVCCMILKEA